ncbi:uncharacterized protein [Drosophila kikkawai]|uniref:Uncharacterized protein LOC108085147 n=1 Tax=Drosophila kikkawai TaxID=30033 RepID=A0A6P4J8F8_DROKI|nr:uncharacterized protein LOC108085147 [Drosophila kikkawai]
MNQLTRMSRTVAGGLKMRFQPPLRHLNQPNLSPEDPTKRPSPMQSMREFFMHPLTWDRNNGYFNVVLALTLFGFVFFSSCSSCDQKKGLQETQAIQSDKAVSDAVAVSLENSDK